MTNIVFIEKIYILVSIYYYTQGENMVKEKEEKKVTKKIKVMEMNSLTNMDTLTKLRLVVISIFALSTLGMILLLIGGWVIAAVLILISYIMIFGLMVKLLIIKKL